MKSLLKFLTAFLIFFSFIETSISKEITQKQEKDYSLFLKSFTDKMKEIKPSINLLSSQISNLSNISVNSALDKTVEEKIRFIYADAYLWVNDLENALDNLYLAVDSKDTKKTQLSDQHYELLIKTWSKKNSKASVRKHLRDYLSLNDSAAKPFVYEIFLSNNYIENSDYLKLKRAFFSHSLSGNRIKYLFSKVAIKFGDFDTATQTLSTLQRSKEFESKKYYALGTIETIRGNLTKAASFFEKALGSIDERDFDLIEVSNASNMALGRIYSKQRDFKKAITYYDKISKSSVFTSDALFEKSYAYYKMGQTPRSLEILDFLLLSTDSSSIYLNSMSIKGDELKLESIQKTAMESYSELIARLEYEKFKLKELMDKYEGSESNILALLEPTLTSTDYRAVPTPLSVKVLLKDSSVDTALHIEREFAIAIEAIDEIQIKADIIKRSYDNNKLLISLRNTMDWLYERIDDTFDISMRVNEAYYELLKSLGISPPPYYRQFITLKTKNLNEINQDEVCMALTSSSTENIKNLEDIGRTITNLKEKTFDLNDLLMSNWTVVDGQRETQVLDIKNRSEKEYSELLRLEIEKRYDSSLAQRGDYLYKRSCQSKFLPAKRDLISASLKNLIALVKDTKDRLVEKYGLLEYDKIERSINEIHPLSVIPKKAQDFLQRLSAKEESLINSNLPSLDKLVFEAQGLKTKLLKLKKTFDKKASSIMKLAMKRTYASFEDYKQDYSWGIIDLEFNEKTKLEDELKNLHVERELETSRTQNNYKLILNEN